MQSGFRVTETGLRYTHLYNNKDVLGRFLRIAHSAASPSFLKETVGPAPKATGNAFKVMLKAEGNSSKLERTKDLNDPSKPSKGGSNLFNYHCAKLQSAKFNRKEAVERWHEKMNYTSFSLASGRQTYDPYTDQNTTSPIAYENMKKILRDNDCPPRSDTLIDLWNAEELLIAKADKGSMMKLAKEHLKGSEFLKRIFTWTGALKDKERDRGERREIWIVSMFTKLPYKLFEIMSEILLNDTDSEFMNSGGERREQQIIVKANTIGLKSSPVVISGDEDDTKFNQQINTEMMDAMFAGLFHDMPEVYTMISSMLDVGKTRWVKLPPAHMMDENGRSHSVEAEYVKYEQLSEDIKELISEAKWKVIQSECKESGVFRGTDMMGMGMWGKGSTLQKCITHQMLQDILKGDQNVMRHGVHSEENMEGIAEYMCASDDARIGATNWRTIKMHIQMNRMAGYQISDSKTIYYEGTGKMDSTGELVGTFFNGAIISPTAGQAVNQITQKEENLYDEIQSTSTGCAQFVSKGGVVAGYQAVRAANRSMNWRLGFTQGRGERLKRLKVRNKTLYNATPLHKEDPLSMHSLSIPPFLAHMAATGRTDILSMETVNTSSDRSFPAYSTNNMPKAKGVYAINTGQSHGFKKKEYENLADIKKKKEEAEHLSTLLMNHTPSVLIDKSLPGRIAINAALEEVERDCLASGKEELLTRIRSLKHYFSNIRPYGKPYESREARCDDWGET